MNENFEKFQQWGEMSEDERNSRLEKLKYSSNHLGCSNCDALSSLSQYKDALREIVNEIEDWECDHKSVYDGKEQVPTSIFRGTLDEAKLLLLREE